VFREQCCRDHDREQIAISILFADLIVMCSTTEQTSTIEQRSLDRLRRSSTIDFLLLLLCTIDQRSKVTWSRSITIRSRENRLKYNETCHHSNDLQNAIKTSNLTFDKL
jgi:hypothetical protein